MVVTTKEEPAGRTRRIAGIFRKSVCRQARHAAENANAVLMVWTVGRFAVFYSARSATIGSTRDARCAGSIPVTVATAASTAAANANAPGAPALTP
jgi:hypothetical protein